MFVTFIVKPFSYSVIIVFIGSWPVAAMADEYPQCQHAPASLHLGTTFGLISLICQDHTRSDHQLGLLWKNSTKMLVKVEECPSFSSLMTCLLFIIESGLLCCQRVIYETTVKSPVQNGGKTFPVSIFISLDLGLKWCTTYSCDNVSW